MNLPFLSKHLGLLDELKVHVLLNFEFLFVEYLSENLNVKTIIVTCILKKFNTSIIVFVIA